MTTGKTIALTRQTIVGKLMSLLFNRLSRLVITFLPRSKYLLISRLQSPSAVILEPRRIKSATVSPSICHAHYVDTYLNMYTNVMYTEDIFPNPFFLSETMRNTLTLYLCAWVLICSVMSNFLWSWIVAGQALLPWDSPGQNIGMGCHALFHRIFQPRD